MSATLLLCYDYCLQFVTNLCGCAEDARCHATIDVNLAENEVVLGGVKVILPQRHGLLHLGISNS